MIDVPVRATYGLFDDPHGYANGKLFIFSEMLLQNCSKHHGHAAPLFIKTLIKKMPCLNLQTRLDALYQGFGKDLSAQEGRAAKTFACVALAGELATEWGIVPWKVGDAKDAALQIFEHWKEAQPNLARSREHAQILKKVTDFIERHSSSSRFLDINWTPGVDHWGNKEGTPSVRECAGYYEEVGEERRFLFTAGGLTEATQGFDFRRVLQALQEADAFYDKGTGLEKAKRRRTPDGQNLKLYHIDPAKLEL